MPDADLTRRKTAKPRRPAFTAVGPEAGRLRLPASIKDRLLAYIKERRHA